MDEFSTNMYLAFLKAEMNKINTLTPKKENKNKECPGAPKRKKSEITVDLTEPPQVVRVKLEDRLLAAQQSQE
jgi:hypothetical protein